MVTPWGVFLTSGSWVCTKRTTRPGTFTPERLSQSHSRDYFRRIHRNNNLTQKLLVFFPFQCSTERMLTYCICVWLCSCTAADKKALQQDFTAKRITRRLPAFLGGYGSHCRGKCSGYKKSIRRCSNGRILWYKKKRPREMTAKHFPTFMWSTTCRTQLKRGIFLRGEIEISNWDRVIAQVL